MRRFVLVLLVLIATAAPVLARPVPQLTDAQKAKILPWINRAVESVNSMKTPDLRVLKIAAAFYSSIGRNDLAQPLMARLSESDRAQVLATQIAESYKTDRATSIDRAKEIKDADARDMALSSIQILALRADDVATATQAAGLVGKEFRASLAWQSICDYHFHRGEIAQAKAAAGKITDEGYKKRAKHRFILQPIIDQERSEKELVAAAEKQGLSREDVSHAIGDFIDRETSAGHLDRAEALLRQVNFAPFEFGNGLGRIGLEAAARKDQPRYRRLIAEAQTMVAKCDPGFGPLLQGFIRTCRIESGEAAAVVEEIRADKPSAQDLAKMNMIDPLLLRALVWAGRPDEAIAAVKPGTDSMLFTPGSLPATLIVKGYDSQLEAWWKTLTNPTDRADVALGAVFGYAQLFDDKK